MPCDGWDGDGMVCHYDMVVAPCATVTVATLRRWYPPAASLLQVSVGLYADEPKPKRVFWNKNAFAGSVHGPLRLHFRATISTWLHGLRLDPGCGKIVPRIG